MDFKEIYVAYWQKVFRLCMGFVNDGEWARDIAQDSFVQIWEALPGFRNESSIGTWIFRIATNQCLRQMERARRLPKSELMTDIPETAGTDIETQTAFLYKCIAALPETDRIIISLELENVKQAEIASIVGISETNVRVKIHRIKEKLTAKFSKHEERI
ncbi:MAG TPA: RNA polymerase sigma factor [Chitinophaga sp.]|uniref:RNA polymerase sigma factor n=1 Tax=Chitinophaga sp. TaxID=1869181 RepID=UPI002C37AB1C|nr:RNA polymerase sigma factor [Chitinophaga sp.]HVI44221.1 RNA polymerase sigma factor [Chitinophaga sp.]